MDEEERASMIRCGRWRVLPDAQLDAIVDTHTCIDRIIHATPLGLMSERARS